MQNSRLKDASTRYTEKSLLTFLEGKCSEKWVLGILRASQPEDITRALQSLSFYDKTPRFEFLRKIYRTT